MRVSSTVTSSVNWRSCPFNLALLLSHLSTHCPLQQSSISRHQTSGQSYTSSFQSLMSKDTEMLETQSHTLEHHVNIVALLIYWIISCKISHLVLFGHLQFTGEIMYLYLHLRLYIGWFIMSLPRLRCWLGLYWGYKDLHVLAPWYRSDPLKHPPLPVLEPEIVRCGTAYYPSQQPADVQWQNPQFGRRCPGTLSPPRSTTNYTGLFQVCTEKSLVLSGFWLLMFSYFCPLKCLWVLYKCKLLSLLLIWIILLTL